MGTRPRTVKTNALPRVVGRATLGLVGRPVKTERPPAFADAVLVVSPVGQATGVALPPSPMRPAVGPVAYLRPAGRRGRL